MSPLQPSDAIGPAPAGGAAAPAEESEPAGSGAGSAAGPPTPRFGAEAFLFLLLLATAAAILFQDLFVVRTLTLTPASLHKRFNPYWYGDSASGGKSTIHADRARPL